MNNVFFQFPSNVFAAHYRKQTILLNIEKNEYLSLGKKATHYLSILLLYQFQFKNNFYTPIVPSPETSLNFSNLNELNLFIVKFIEENIVEVCFSKCRKNHIAHAKKPIGLNQLEWLPDIKNLAVKLSLLELLEAVIALAKVHKALKKLGLQGLIDLINLHVKKAIKYRSRTKITPVENLVVTLDQASLIFPKKTKCLPWAGALMLLLIKQGLNCDLFIGIQTLPFYAHAWVETNGVVINDNPQVQERLAPILSMSFVNDKNIINNSFLKINQFNNTVRKR